MKMAASVSMNLMVTFAHVHPTLLDLDVRKQESTVCLHRVNTMHPAM